MVRQLFRIPLIEVKNFFAKKLVLIGIFHVTSCYNLQFTVELFVELPFYITQKFIKLFGYLPDIIMDNSRKHLVLVRKIFVVRFLQNV